MSGQGTSSSTTRSLRKWRIVADDWPPRRRPIGSSVLGYCGPLGGAGSSHGGLAIFSSIAQLRAVTYQPT
jgi:hypothetical protein